MAILFLSLKKCALNGNGKIKTVFNNIRLLTAKILMLETVKTWVK